MADQKTLISGDFFEFEKDGNFYRFERSTKKVYKLDLVTDTFSETNEITLVDTGGGDTATHAYFFDDDNNEVFRLTIATSVVEINRGGAWVSTVESFTGAGDNTGANYDPTVADKGVITLAYNDSAEYSIINSRDEIVSFKQGSSNELEYKKVQLQASSLTHSNGPWVQLDDSTPHNNQRFVVSGDTVFCSGVDNTGNAVRVFAINTLDMTYSVITIQTVGTFEPTNMALVGDTHVAVFSVNKNTPTSPFVLGGIFSFSGTTMTPVEAGSGNGFASGLMTSLTMPSTSGSHDGRTEFVGLSDTKGLWLAGSNPSTHYRYEITFNTGTGTITIGSQNTETNSTPYNEVCFSPVGNNRVLVNAQSQYFDIYDPTVGGDVFKQYLQESSTTPIGNSLHVGVTPDNVALVLDGLKIFKIQIPQTGTAITLWDEVNHGFGNISKNIATDSSDLVSRGSLIDGRLWVGYGGDIYVITL